METQILSVEYWRWGIQGYISQADNTLSYFTIHY